MPKSKPISREECDLKEKVTANTLAAIHTDVIEMRKELKTALEWQNQFKGGIKAFGILVGLLGTIGGLVFGSIKLFKHGG